MVPLFIGHLAHLDKLVVSQNNLHSLTLDGGGVPGVGPLGIFPQLTCLVASSNSIKIIPSSLASLSKLAKLVLDRNKVAELPSAHLPSRLTFLSLANNALTSLSPLELPLLTHLDLSNNSIASLAPQAFSALVALETLNLSFNNITSLESTGIGACTSLTLFNIESNQLESIPEDFGQLVHLQTAILANNKLTSLPSSFDGLGQLAVLFLDGNKISSVSFTNSSPITQSLGELYVRGNKLDSLTAICNLGRLKTLSASANRFDSIPPAVSQLVDCTSIDLGENNIDSVSKSIATLNALRQLNLTYNPIQSLPTEMSRMSWLEDLSLAKTPLISQIDRQLQRKGIKGILEHIGQSKSE
eukprot:gene5932-6871_t